MGTLTIPNLETAMQKHRDHLDFAIQSGQVWDAMLFAQLINSLLPHNNRLMIATPPQLLAYNPNYALPCPYCHNHFQISREMLQHIKQPTELPKNYVLPEPITVTTGDKLDKQERAWSWVKQYMIKLEGHVSDITWATLRTSRE